MNIKQTEKMKEVLNRGFTEVNAKVTELSVSRIESLFKAYEKYMSETEREDRNVYKLIDLCGGKGNWHEFMDNDLEGTKVWEQENTERNFAKRDAKIIKKLSDKGITEIPEFHAGCITSDGFQGQFGVGDYTVDIHIIVAGGYNIQRIHNRTLVTITEN